MKTCKRIEIVIEKSMVPRLTTAIKQVGVDGYTLIPDVRGSGDRGMRRADELSGESSNCLVLIACDNPAIVEALLEAVRPLLVRAGGVCLVSDAQWLRH
jgi:nitrogen regulatory protein PII